MKIYFAAALNREKKNETFNKILNIENHLESYFTIKKTKCDISKWDIFEERNNENK